MHEDPAICHQDRAVLLRVTTVQHDPMAEMADLVEQFLPIATGRFPPVPHHFWHTLSMSHCLFLNIHTVEAIPLRLSLEKWP
jgi:hypothetical protein